MVVEKKRIGIISEFNEEKTYCSIFQFEEYNVIKGFFSSKKIYNGKIGYTSKSTYYGGKLYDTPEEAFENSTYDKSKYCLKGCDIYHKCKCVVFYKNSSDVMFTKQFLDLKSKDKFVNDLMCKMNNPNISDEEFIRLI